MEETWVPIVVLLAVLLVATTGGLIWRVRDGRIRTTVPKSPTASEPGAEPEPAIGPVWASIGVEPANAAVTLVQFSSAFCAPCRATRRILTDVAGQLPDVHHVEVDAESHLDAVRALGVRTTPTTLLVDREGQIAGRAVGQPRTSDVAAAVGPFLARSKNPKFR